MQKSRRLYNNISITLLLCALISFGSKNTQQENHAPVVKIISPKNNTLLDFNSQLNYQVSVVDKEDGDSKYDEINAKEVLLEVRYFADRSKIQSVLNKGMQPDPQGITVMRTSNCFNCHNFNGKGIGPSFYEISKRYPATKANTDTLIKHIKEGSANVWGKEKMPTHPELTSDEIKSTVQWILKHAADPAVDYYIGTEGSFRIKPIGNPSKGGYLLTASYLDHGLKTAVAKQRLKGQDMVVVFGK
jgi:cytochrome c